jgi:outer membrane protein insertion porin family
MLPIIRQSIHTSHGGENLTRLLPPLSAAIILLILTAPAGATLAEPAVDSISVTGSVPAPLSELLEGTGLETGASLLRITPQEVKAGIEYNLKSLGFLDPSVTVVWPSWDEDASIVHIEIQPGARSVLSGMAFNGVSLFRADTLAGLYPGSPGSPITPYDTLTMRNSVLDLYSQRGYIHAEMDIRLGTAGEEQPSDDGSYSNRSRTIECTIEEGLQSHLGSVSVEGLETVRAKVVTRELLISPGDSLDMGLLRRSIRAIYQLGLFQDVSIAYLPDVRDSLLMDIRIIVTESRYRRVDLGCGYMSPQAVFGSAGWTHPNIMGNNQKLSVSMYYMTYIGQDEGWRIEPEIIYEEPWFLSTRWSWQQKLGYLNLTIPGLEQRSWSITTSFARDLTRYLRLTLGYSLEYERYAETGSAGGELPEVRDWSATSSITSSLVHDTRFPQLNPIRGHWFMGGGKLSGGFMGGHDFYRLVGESRLFLPVGSSITLAVRLRTGGAFPFGRDTSVPPDDRFFLGGGSTVRGYAENGIGPRDDDGNPIGGRMELLGNFEVRMTIVGNFGIVLFADAGGLWNTLSDINLDSSGFGTGFGVRYNTVFGPLRLDYGFAPTWSNALKRGKVYIGVGHVF